MNTETTLKYNQLKNHIKELGSVVVAFSGGVDSSLLCKICRDVLGDKAIAVTVVSPMIPGWDLEDARHIAEQTGIKHIQIQENDIEEQVRQNPENRCYFCKKTEFGSIVTMAKEMGFQAVVDGSNADDKNDYRPGAQAANELQVISPLQLAGFTKAEIRELSKEFGLKTWSKPAYACLGSRIPYGTYITDEKLSQVEKSERYLHSLGYAGVRVRCHDNIARIELLPSEMERFCKQETMVAVSQKLKEFGFLYVCLELEGYSMGSLNRKFKLDNGKSAK